MEDKDKDKGSYCFEQRLLVLLAVKTIGMLFGDGLDQHIFKLR